MTALPPWVVPFDDWTVKGRWWPTSKRRQQSTAVVLHHSVTDTTGRSSHQQAQDIEQVIYDRRRRSRFSMVAYSFIVATDGTLFEGRGVTYRNGANNDTKNTGYTNTNTMSVCFAGNYQPGVAGVPELQPTPAQLRAVGDLAGWLHLAKELTGDYEILPHRHVHATACPGDNIVNHIDELELYAQFEPTHTEGPQAMQIINDPEAQRMWAGWDKAGTQHVREYSNYRGAHVGDALPGIGYVIDEQVAAGNIEKVS